LAKNDILLGWSRIIDYNECVFWKTSCYLVRQDSTGKISQLSNSWVEFRNLTFYVSNTPIKKVTIQFEIQPSIHKWIKPNIIKENKIFFETTLSERLYNK
jgi:hypothetical protein